jgi:hypothetical protein
MIFFPFFNTQIFKSIPSISAQNKKVFLESFMVKFNVEKFSVHWILEVSPDDFHETTNWSPIFEQNKTERKQIKFKPLNPSRLSSFRFTMIGKNSVNSNGLFLLIL